MTTKFDSQATRSLYNSEPDDSIGHSLNGFSWYGLYRAEESGGGFIVVEDTYGNVGRAEFETTAALDLAWQDLALDLESTGLYDDAVGL